jgi:ubiquitin-protein ligase
MRRLNNLYEEFQKIPSIEEHFQITGYKFTVERKDERTFHFNTVTVPNIKLKLPPELTEHIQSYLIENTVIEMKYPSDYPFKCPHFSLVSGDKPGILILNYGYDRDWSPAITFEKDVLNLIQYII